MARIRKDLVGSVLVTVPGEADARVLVAGDKVPKAVKVGAHVLEPRPEKPEETAVAETQPEEGSEESPKVPTGTVQGEAPALTPPPQAGAGSSVEAWRTYAREATAAHGLNVDIPADAKRSDIIEALTDAQIPVE